jgi:hypothetical protein
MSTISGSLRLRPTRIGFLADPNDREAIQKIFQLGSCLWGGLFNPIIPVCDTIPEAWTDPLFAPPSPGELARGYVDFLEPDVFVEAKPGLAARVGVPPNEFGGEPRTLPLESFFSTTAHYPFAVPFGLDCFGVYQALYDREFKFVSRHERRIAYFEPVPEQSPFIEAAFGAFPSDGPMSRLARDYADAFDPVPLAANAENWIRAIRDGFRFPLSFTMEGLKRDFHSWSEPTLVIVDPTSPLDLIDLWNMRQFHTQALPISVGWLRDASEFLREFIKASSLGNSSGGATQTAIQFGRSLVSSDREKALVRGKALLSKAGLADFGEAPWVMKLGYEPIWIADQEDFGHRPQRTGIEAATTNLELTISGEGLNQFCQFTALSPEFVTAFAEFGEARWANVLRLRSYRASDTLALALPSSFTSLSGRLRIGGPSVISRDGLVLLQNSKHHSEWLNLMTGEQVMVDWLQHIGLFAKRSEPGRIGEQILSSLGGFWGTVLIADADTLKLLDDMAKSVKTYSSGTVEEFPDRSAGVKQWQDLLSRRSSGPRGHRRAAALDRFIDANILRLGLELTCTNCGKRNWVGIGDMREQIICERCLKAFAFPQGSLDFRHTPWRYRVIGPYSVPDFAGGAYSTVLALAVFARRLGSDEPNITYTTGLEMRIGNDNPFEVDFAFWYQRNRMFARNEEPALVFGEARSFAAESFKQADVGRMRKLAERFPGAFIVFATLKDSFGPEEAKAIGEFTIWGRGHLQNGLPRTPVIALTGTELFCDWRVDQRWKELGGQRAALVTPPAARLDNLHRLARFTQDVYLGLPVPGLPNPSTPRHPEGPEAGA